MKERSLPRPVQLEIFGKRLAGIGLNPELVAVSVFNGGFINLVDGRMVRIEVLENRFHGLLDLDKFLDFSFTMFRNSSLVRFLDLNFRHPPYFQQPDMVHIDGFAFGQKKAAIDIPDILAKGHAVFQLVYGNELQ